MTAAAATRWSPGYREWLPPAALRASLACMWISVAPADGGSVVTDVLPDGCSDLIWQSGYGGYVAGPDTGPAPAEMPPGTILVGARFRPGAGGPALGLPLARLRDQRVDLAACLPALAKELPADLSADIALRLVTGWSARMVSASPADPIVTYGIRLLVEGRATVAQLSKELAVSERQLRRRFDATVGYGPKTLHRVLRFRQVVARLSSHAGKPDLAALAVQTGYADQAHLTRETTRLAGRPPAALARVLRPA